MQFFRPDLVVFVNRLPPAVVELKKPDVPARAAFDENLTHHKQQILALFWFNALLIASNGTYNPDTNYKWIERKKMPTNKGGCL